MKVLRKIRILEKLSAFDGLVQNLAPTVPMPRQRAPKPHSATSTSTPTPVRAAVAGKAVSPSITLMKNIKPAKKPMPSTPAKSPSAVAQGAIASPPPSAPV